MANLKRYRAAEQELLTRLSHAARPDTTVPLTEHPSHGELQRFATGKVRDEVQADKLWSHLGDCNGCVDIMAKIRIRAIWMRRATVVICARSEEGRVGKEGGVWWWG